ncbi:hypothetical protein [Sphingobium terrigena]|uniref:hypothetical protein n=1 Tax=Sphingobium terrigena TaxID=2304063 RepID=UPI0011C469E7|nr:hypothetical protein [Sphingobium terrigena]
MPITIGLSPHFCPTISYQVQPNMVTPTTVRFERSRKTAIALPPLRYKPARYKTANLPDPHTQRHSAQRKRGRSFDQPLHLLSILAEGKISYMPEPGP